MEFSPAESTEKEKQKKEEKKQEKKDELKKKDEKGSTKKKTEDGFCASLCFSSQKQKERKGYLLGLWIMRTIPRYFIFTIKMTRIMTFGASVPLFTCNSPHELTT